MARPAAAIPLRPAEVIPEDARSPEARGTAPGAAEVLRPVDPPSARAPAPEPAATPAPTKGRARRRVLLVLALLALFGAGGWFGWGWWTHGRFVVSTDDAYARADLTQVAAKVGGYLEALPVRENQAVAAGDLLARIDAGDYRLALEAAKARVETGRATVERLDASLAVQRAALNQANADLTSSAAENTRASADYDRYARLVDQHIVATQRVEQALADKARAAAAVEGARARIASAQAGLKVAEAQKAEAARQLDELEVAVERAARDLSFTEVRAPVAGTFGNKAVEVGAYIQPGARLGALVPLGAVYIEANLKETDLARVRVGQEVTVRVDAAGGRVIPGRVVSFSPATGSTFSLLPPENATGNFTKIVQRVPARIAVSREDAASVGLRAGLSVVVEIDTRTGAPATETAAPAAGATAPAAEAAK